MINRIMDQSDLVLASRDWHPEDSIHFDRWPPHCIRETRGAYYPDELDVGKIEKEFLKGTGNTDDGYSAFEATSEDMDDFLRNKTRRNYTWRSFYPLWYSLGLYTCYLHSAQ